MSNVHASARNMLLPALVALVVLASALLVFAPVASASREDCPPAKVCLWAGSSYEGQQAFFNGEDHGWHTLENINPQSSWNHTGNHWVRFNTLRIPGGYTGWIFIE
jgi:Peptidase inhibitor family I36